MTILGAVLAGGRSSRFGSDKAMALFEGRALIDWTIDALAPQVEAVAVCGRAHCGLAFVEDRPAPGLGPLAAICGALAYAKAHGFAAVASVPCDAPGVPRDLVARLMAAGGGAAFVAEMPVVGLWPVALADALDAHLARDTRRSIRGWAEAVCATAVTLPVRIANVNTPHDLAGLTLQGE